MILHIGKGILNKSKIFYFDPYNLGELRGSKRFAESKSCQFMTGYYILLVRIGVFAHTDVLAFQVF